ncbi:unnamed protein product [Trichobilharzia regenti]|nr:unnamed protein product [Trichobilharzia regenti]
MERFSFPFGGKLVFIWFKRSRNNSKMLSVESGIQDGKGVSTGDLFWVITKSYNSFSSTYVVNRVTDKLTQLTKSIYCCRSGSAADTQTIADMVRYKLDFHRLEMDREPTVLEAAMSCRHFCYNYRDDLTAGIIVAGWDSELGGQSRSQDTEDLCSNPQQFRNVMISFSLLNLGVALAINRDGSSGGCIRLAIISKDGVERRLTKGDEVPVYRFS